MKKLFLLVPGVLALLLSLTLLGRTAFAATTQPAGSANLSKAITTMQQRCSAVGVRLNRTGAQPTLQCLKVRPQGSPVGKASPFIWRDNACSGWDFTIENYNSSAMVCFQGTGSMDVAIYQVNSVYNGDTEPGAFNYTGGKIYLEVSQRYVFSWTGYTGITVTHICVNGVGGC